MVTVENAHEQACSKMEEKTGHHGIKHLSEEASELLLFFLPLPKRGPRAAKAAMATGFKAVETSFSLC